MTESKTASAPVSPDRPRPDEAAPDPGLAVLAIADEPARTPALTPALDDPAAGPLRVTSTALPTAVSTLLAGGPFDCILLSLALPADQWTETLAHLRTVAPDLPVVVYTERDDAALGRTLIAAGAEDWLCAADQDARLLVRALHHAVERHRLRNQQRQRAAAADLEIGRASCRERV